MQVKAACRVVMGGSFSKRPWPACTSIRSDKKLKMGRNSVMNMCMNVWKLVLLAGCSMALVALFYDPAPSDQSSLEKGSEPEAVALLTDEVVETVETVETTAPSAEIRSLFTVKGVVKSIEEDLSSARIEHEEIPGYMQAMTMPFAIGDADEWTSLQTGDSISFLLHVTDERSWIDGVEKTPEEVPSLEELSKTAPWRPVREVEFLQVGDELPDYPLTNQLSQAISTHQFRGKVLALTFIYTRCPLPDFCPRMNQQFMAAQRALKEASVKPASYHFLSVSFDPVHDTPERLQFYANAYQHDPKQWSFATGELIEIDALTEQFGLVFYRSEDSLLDWDHNLRTILIDQEGIIRE
ncbi:MAG: SCO family protein, partial [Limisphaerales bacterium]